MTMDNLGKKKVATKDKYVHAMRNAVEHKLYKLGPKTEIKMGIAWFQASKSKLMEAHEQAEQEKGEMPK